MKTRIILLTLLSSVVLTSCMDCMDCKSTTDINLSVEYYSNNNGTMGLDSTTNFSYSGPGLINTTLPLNITSSNDLIPYLSPVNIREYCGDELKNVNNSTVNLQSTIGDSISGIYKYNWSENWDCK